MKTPAGKHALVKVTGAALAFAGEATTTTDHQLYTITSAIKRVWDMEAAITVKVGGVAAAEAYTINRLRGTITFAVVNAARAAVTVDGQYLPTSVAAGAKSYSYTLTGKNDDDSDFDSVDANGGFVIRTPVMLDVSGSLGRRFRFDPYFVNALQAGTPVVIELYPDRTADPELVCWALLNKTQLDAAVDALTSDSIDFDGTTDADGRAASAA